MIGELFSVSNEFICFIFLKFISQVAYDRPRLDDVPFERYKLLISIYHLTQALKLRPGVSLMDFRGEGVDSHPLPKCLNRESRIIGTFN